MEWAIWGLLRHAARHGGRVERVNLLQRDDIDVAVDAQQVMHAALTPAHLRGDGPLTDALAPE